MLELDLENVVNRVAHSTMLIKLTQSSDKTEDGTSFSFCFRNLIGFQIDVPILVTNRHLIENAKRGTIYLHKGVLFNGKYKPIPGYLKFDISQFRAHWIMHPNDKVDLCVLPLSLIHYATRAKGQEVMFSFITDDLLVEDETLIKKFSIAEDVFMIGYPIGLWDSVHNLPIIRKGITSTHPGLDFNGESLFITDMTSVPGSSGSPVLHATEGYYTDKNGNMGYERKCDFLGIQCGELLLSQGGEVAKGETPIERLRTITPVPVSLGRVIRAKEILAFKEILEQGINSGEIKL